MKIFKKNKKISKTLAKKVQKVNKKSEPVISTSLDLKLVELFNVKKYKKPLTSNQFTGELYTANGIIETLSVQLPDNEEIDISFAQMTGNVFNYEFDGTSLSGMMYEVSKGTYMVTLTNGPFSGTRMKFMGEFTESANGFTNNDSYAQKDNYPKDNYDQQYDDQTNKDQSLQASNQENAGQNSQGQFPNAQQGFNFENNDQRGEI